MAQAKGSVDRAAIAEAFGNLFVEAFEPVGDTHGARGAALGMSEAGAANRALGRTIPDKTARALYCLVVVALRKQRNDKARRDLVEQGLELMRAIDAGDFSGVRPAPPRFPGRPSKTKT